MLNRNDQDATMQTYGNPEEGTSIELFQYDDGIRVVVWRNLDVVACEDGFDTIQDARLWLKSLPSDQDGEVVPLSFALAPQRATICDDTVWHLVGEGETVETWFEPGEPGLLGCAFILIDEMTT